ncbi:hypothetical protein ES705_48582 [subsurface metagenome]|jgi:predicted nucleotidyltransferase
METIFRLADVLNMLEQKKDTIHSYGVKNIGVFGSFAKTEQDITSDLDILIEFREGMKSFDNYMNLRFFLEDLFQLKVDLVIKGSIKPALEPYILGSVIYVEGI